MAQAEDGQGVGMVGARVIVGLDIGTTKVCTLIAEVKGPDQIQVVGVGVFPSRGLRKGVVVDMDDASEAIASSLKKAEVFSGYKIVGAFVAVSGAHLESECVSGGLSLAGDRPVSRQDLGEVLNLVNPARAAGRRVLHVIPRGYTIDGENGIRNPIGMLGTRLEVEGLVVSSGAAPLQNLARCVESTGIQVDGFVSAGVASTHAVLSDTEKRLGVLLLDMGGGTTDLIWFQGGEARFVGALPLGGYHLTNDISVGLGVPFSAAEEMKTRFASAVPAAVQAEETIDVGSVSRNDGHPVSRRYMSEIVEARVSEIFDLAMEELRERELEGVPPAGVVLTGGTAQLRGIRELAQQAFDAQARVGHPEGLVGLTDSISSPAYATAAGLLRWVLAQSEDLSGARSMRRHVGVGARLKGLVKAFLP